MKILIASEDIPNPNLGGLGKHALALAHELHRRGHEVDVLGNALHPLSLNPEQSGPGHFLAVMRGHERGWGQTRMGLFHPWASRQRSRAVARAIARHAAGYDVVHYHGHLPWLPRHLPAAVPFTQTRHDQGGDCMLATRFRAEGARCEWRDPAACAGCAAPRPSALQRAVSTWAVRQMRRQTAAAYRQRPVIFVSSFLQDAFAKLGGASAVVGGEVIHNAIDAVALGAALQVPATAARAAGVDLFAAGAFNSYKGFGTLLDEMAQQGGLPTGWTLTLAGDGPDRLPLQRRHASQKVRFLGWCDYNVVLDNTRRASAVIVPSEWDEPCATTVLEALALGRTVFALRRGGTPELAAYAGAGRHRLRLFNTMSQLVKALLLADLQRQAPADANDLLTFEGTVAAMADRVLAHYGRHFPSARD